MELIRGTSNLRDRHRGCVVTIGSYDGIHLGHQAVLERLVVHGTRLARPALMVTFEPMPREYLAPSNPPARLTSLRERCRWLTRMAHRQARLDHVLVLRFGERLRQLSGEQFVQWLARDLDPAGVVVGYDFRFGRDGQGTAESLYAAGKRHGFEVEILDPVMLGPDRLSSSGVRDALAAGDFAKARAWLGRAYSMFGRVIEGERLGRRLGFPTANMRIGRRRAAVGGIFAVRVHGAGLEARPGVGSLGTRPTVGGTVPLLEAHVFDFDGDLYGCELEVEFVAKLREEVRFESLEALVEQMHRDAQQARSLFK
ncbi:MAG: bifunctional riboflavin kinase/FAD synthetase [Gammaproteobacteria bacterium]